MKFGWIFFKLWAAVCSEHYVKRVKLRQSVGNKRSWGITSNFLYFHCLLTWDECLRVTLINSKKNQYISSYKLPYGPSYWQNIWKWDITLLGVIEHHSRKFFPLTCKAKNRWPQVKATQVTRFMPWQDKGSATCLFALKNRLLTWWVRWCIHSCRLWVQQTTEREENQTQNTGGNFELSELYSVVSSVHMYHACNTALRAGVSLHAPPCCPQCLCFLTSEPV